LAGSTFAFKSGFSTPALTAFSTFAFAGADSGFAPVPLVSFDLPSTLVVSPC
jgi:hypothetical protein